MPASTRMEETKQLEWITTRMSEIRTSVQDIRADTTVVNMNCVEPGIMNEKSPGAGSDISKVIETLSAQNQAGLKTMATVIGRGASGQYGVGGSPHGGDVCRRAQRAAGGDPEQHFFVHDASGWLSGFAEVTFTKGELRPVLELEPQMTMGAARLQTDRSLGLITDLEYHIQLYHRLPPDGAPQLSGIGFIQAAVDGNATAKNAASVTPNSDPLDRVTGPQSDQIKRR